MAKATPIKVTAPLFERWVTAGDEAYLLGVKDADTRPEIMTSGSLELITEIAAGMSSQSNEDYPRWIAELVDGCKIDGRGRKPYRFPAKKKARKKNAKK